MFAPMVDACTLSVQAVTPCEDGAHGCTVGPHMHFVTGGSLSCTDGRFGGLSGLAVADMDGETLVAISDRGGIWSQFPSRPFSGAQATIGNHGAGNDAEAITLNSDRTRSYVSFERSEGVISFTGILESKMDTVASLTASVNADCGYGNLQYESLELLDDASLLACALTPGP